ncbi:MAG: hypothetical protein WAM82_09020 [Thermoanaerobaculia bacterium]
MAIDEALRCKESGERQVIAFNLSGHGHFDMTMAAGMTGCVVKSPSSRSQDNDKVVR